MNRSNYNLYVDVLYIFNDYFLAATERYQRISVNVRKHQRAPFPL